MVFDYIVVGSGNCGAMAAYTLVEAGVNVAILDVGETDNRYQNLISASDFEEIRTADPKQHRYFIGDYFEGIPWEGVKVGAQLTPPRKHVVRNTKEFLPLISDTFEPMESLAYGGLGSSWGLGCYVYSESELVKTGLNPKKINQAYQEISKRIGISAEIDDASPYTIGHLENFLPSVKMDKSLQYVFDKYKNRRSEMNKMGVFVGNPSIAMLTKDYNNRLKTDYADMDFYTDQRQSAYRPWMTINELKKKNNFTYIDKSLVLSFTDENNVVKVNVKNTLTNEIQVYECNKLILCSGALGSARIVMRTFSNQIKKLPVLCNPYIYLPCINLKMIGKNFERNKTSMVQCVMFYDTLKKNEDVISVSLYTYRSLLLFKLVKETPLNFADGRIIMNYLQSSFVIAGIHFPDSFGKEKFLELKPNINSYTKDELHATYKMSEEQSRQNFENEKVIKKALRKLGCIPVKRIFPKIGASIHYAGTIPFSENNIPGKTAKNGKLHGTKNVYIADGSSFNYLPAKGITFTLMANAHVVALNALANRND